MARSPTDSTVRRARVVLNLGTFIRILESVAGAADGSDWVAGARLVQLATDASEHDLDQVVAALQLETPDVLEYLSPAHELTTIDHQIFEDGALPCCQRHQSASDVKGAGARVEPHAARLDLRLATRQL